MWQKLTFVCLFFIVHSCYAQQYLFERYTPKDGLVNNRTRFFFQDSRGRLYISTFGGLSVYDGSRFINYTTENGLAASLVNDIVEMGEDSFWIVPNANALHCLVHGTIRNITTADNFYPVINQILRCSDGYLYAISDDGLFRYENNRFARVLTGDSTAIKADHNFLQAVQVDRKLILLNDPYLGAFPHNAALLVYDLDTHKLIISANDQRFYYLVKSPANDILVTTSEGVRVIDKEALKEGSIVTARLPPPYQAANDLHAGYFYFDRSAALWLSTEDGIIKLDTSGEKEVFNVSTGLPPGYTSGIFQDKENNVWFANDRNGIIKIASRQVLHYTQPKPDFTANDLYTDAGSDSLWLYDGARHEILLVKGERQQLFHGLGPLPGKGHIFIGKRSYLVSDNHLFALHFLPGGLFSLSLLHTDTASLEGYGCFDHRGNLVIVTNRMLLWSGGRMLQYPLRAMSDQAGIDKQNRIWTITRSNALTVFGLFPTDTGATLRVLADYLKVLPVMSPRCIAIDNEGRVWVGTRDHGLYCLFFDGLRLLSYKHLTASNGLSENFVNYLQCDPDNTVWACTPGGLDRIRPRNGGFAIDDITHTNDDYQSIYRILPAAKGVHWALVKGGYMKIGSPPVEKNSYQPHLLFSQVLSGNDLVETTDKTLRLPYDHNAIAFSIGVTSFINETETRYSYLLEGSNNLNWSTPSDRSAINLVNLAPGRYTLRVKAQFLTGDYPDLTAAYPFVILPPWWQTWWFRTAAATALAAILLLLIRFYIRRKLLVQRIALENKQAIEKERTRIATDMHDDLGAGLSRIKFLSETIGIKKQQHLPFEEEISGIRRYSHEMIDKMGEIVWALNERNDSLSDLLSYTRSYAAEYLLQAGIRCQVDIPADSPSCFVSGEFRRNVYLTIKEALHNIVKHAQAEQVSIRMTITHPDRTLIITITDDGIGFDPNTIRPFCNGLSNMQRRIGDLGGSLRILREQGTTIELSVPL
ncbi:sensor histidine kinase [Puia dinghuensis]|uniref:histidine kinase n=1 Tax=Puia dinghuensis TaxID=1792502 RepID=A0A8J2U661_9BACT|nr:sensor histidine kinase [Puia dinghuensis]GGA81560.1 hypothetical protein GCM10011511_00620 [Puia dinghuensis]